MVILQVALLISAAGLACTYVIYDCEQQRLLFRRSHGKCRIWGKIPNKVGFHTLLHLIKLEVLHAC
jgi:hypothetical protein